MAEVIRMPRMSDTMEEGNIVGWLKKVGDAVEPGDVLAEVETDKATMELESYQEGVLLYIGIEEGPVPVNGVLAVIGEEGEDYKAALEAAEAESGSAVAEEQAPESQKVEVTANASATVETVTAPAPAVTEEKRLKASPLAKKIASDAGVDISQVLWFW